MKHIKQIHPEVQEIIKSGMLPIVKLMESNYNFDLLEKLEKKKQVPDFRHEALETLFCEHLEIICNILKSFGNLV